MQQRIGVLTMALLGLVATTAAAQPADPGHARTDVAGGYAFVRERTPGGTTNAYPRGWVISGAHQLFFDRLLAVGELGASSRSNIVDEAQHLRAILAGGRVRLTQGARLATFAQVLVGSHRFSEPGYEASGLAVQPGVGVDVGILGPVGVRGQVDYRIARERDITFKHLRAAIGAVVWFPR